MANERERFTKEDDVDKLWKELRKTVRDQSRIATVVLKRDENGFGFNIRGGIDHPHVGCDPGIFITTVRADGAAGKDGRLKPGDRLLAVDSTRLDYISHDQAVKAFRVSDECVTLLVEQGAEAEILGSPRTPVSPLSPGVGVQEVDSRYEEDKSTIPSGISMFLGSTAGALSLGIMAGSLLVFVGLRIYKAVTK